MALSLPLKYSYADTLLQIINSLMFWDSATIYCHLTAAPATLVNWNECVWQDLISLALKKKRTQDRPKWQGLILSNLVHIMETDLNDDDDNFSQSSM